MVRNGILRYAALAILLGCWGLTAAAAPRFTDKDTALELAKTLDKGIFRGQLITSTYVLSPKADEYLVKVVLDNGAELTWDLEQIRLWSRENSLTLSKNNVLVFPDEDTNEFGVLDKNGFTRSALRARIYVKRYKPPDILSGTAIHYGIHQFDLVDLLKLAPSQDRRGYLHRYVLELQNGQREFLSYLDAWEILNSGSLLDEPAAQPVMIKPYRLQSIEALPLQRITEEGIGRFALEMRFDRSIKLQSGHFPFRLFERKPRPGKAALDNRFVLEFTAPNAVMPEAVNQIETLEFLRGIHAVADGENQNRVLLRAMIAPEVLTTPPKVEVFDQTVALIFTKVEDQSVFDRKTLQEAELRRREEKMLAPTLTPEDVERRRLYRQHIETGLGQLDKARATGDLNERYEEMLAALANFREAAIQASSDKELEEALRQRNNLALRLPALILKHARESFKEPPHGAEGSRLNELVEAATRLTRDPAVRESLQNVEGRIKEGN